MSNLRPCRKCNISNLTCKLGYPLLDQLVRLLHRIQTIRLLIKRVWFMKERLFIKHSADGRNFYELDPKTKDFIGKGYFLPSRSEVVMNNSFFGII